MNMSMIEYRTFTYIMYKENMERQRQQEEEEKRRLAEEAARRADANKQQGRPTTLAEARERARQAREAGLQENSSTSPMQGIDTRELAEMIEDELM